MKAYAELPPQLAMQWSSKVIDYGPSHLKTFTSIISIASFHFLSPSLSPICLPFCINSVVVLFPCLHPRTTLTLLVVRSGMDEWAERGGRRRLLTSIHASLSCGLSASAFIWRPRDHLHNPDRLYQSTLGPNLGSSTPSVLQYNSWGGDGTEAGLEIKMFKALSYALFPVLWQRFCIEEKLIHPSGSEELSEEFW